MAAKQHDTELDNFTDPADMQNFLSRYREARSAQQARPQSTPTTPSQSSAPAPPSPRKASLSRTEQARNIWGSVFHPLGRSPTSADRYDLSPGQTSQPGMSASEVHAKGRGISLDETNDDM